MQIKMEMEIDERREKRKGRQVRRHHAGQKRITAVYVKIMQIIQLVHSHASEVYRSYRSYRSYQSYRS